MGGVRNARRISRTKRWRAAAICPDPCWQVRHRDPRLLRPRREGGARRDLGDRAHVSRTASTTLSSLSCYDLSLEMNLVERVATRYLLRVATVVVHEERGEVQVSGTYTEMQKLIWPLKNLGFRWN